jgi:hypothetical protein
MVGNSSPVGPSSPEHSKEAELMRQSVPGKGIKAKPMHFLGMYFNSEQASQLWQVIIQAVGREIDKEKTKMIKAIRKMRPDADIDDPD